MIKEIFNIKALVLENIKLNPYTFRLILRAPEIASSVKPGQFCMLKVRDQLSYDPLLRRPFSINRVENKDIHILYRVVGKGTKYMSNLSKEDQIEILGPLGNGFKIIKNKINILVAGGMGIAPISFLTSSLPKDKTIVIVGAANKEELFDIDYIKNQGYSLFIATDDGSMGKKGLVTEILKEKLDELLLDKGNKDIVVYSCGPYPMLKNLANICKRLKIDAQVSMEAKMACGIGLCLGCVVSKNDGGFLHVCKDGPVFDVNEVNWS